MNYSGTIGFDTLPYIVIISTSPTVGKTCPVLLLSGSFKARRDGMGVGGVGPHGRPSYCGPFGAVRFDFHVKKGI